MHVLHRAVQVAEEAVAGGCGHEVNSNGVALSVEDAGKVIGRGADEGELLRVVAHVDVLGEFGIGSHVAAVHLGGKPDDLFGSGE